MNRIWPHAAVFSHCYIHITEMFRKRKLSDLFVL